MFTFSSGRGRTPELLPSGFLPAAKLTPSDPNFLRDQGENSLDGIAFHYSIYRSLTRFLGMDGNLQVAYDIDTNFITAWNQMFVSNDFLNAATGQVDPRHMYGTSNFDVFRWPSLENGTQRSILATFITTLIMPGIPLVSLLIHTTFSVSSTFTISCSMARSKTFISLIMERRITFMGTLDLIYIFVQV